MAGMSRHNCFWRCDIGSGCKSLVTIASAPAYAFQRPSASEQSATRPVGCQFYVLSGKSGAYADHVPASE